MKDDAAFSMLNQVVPRLSRGSTTCWLTGPYLGMRPPGFDARAIVGRTRTG